MRAEGEVGIQSDAQDLEGIFKGATSPPIRTCGWSQNWYMGIRGEHSHAGFLGNGVQLFPICAPNQGYAELDSPWISLHDAGSRG